VIDRKTNKIFRFASIAKEIPKDFPLEAAKEQVGYESVAFEDGSSFVLPTDFTVSSTYRGQEPTRNSVRVTNCHKFRAKARMVFNSPAGSSVDNSPSANAALVNKELEENSTIYAILREQAVREDAAAIELEHKQELNVDTVGALWRLAALEKQRQKNVAQEEASAKAAPPPTAKEPATTLRVSVKLVPVSVVLRDSKGHAVGNLRKEDFQLFDNGKPQIITSFSEEKTAAASVTKKSLPAPSGMFSSQSKPLAGAERAVAYVFDDIHTTFADLVSVRDAASRHIAALRAEDRAAVFTTSGQIGVDFTDDRQKLQDALKGLRPHPLVSGVRCPPLSAYMADLIVNQDDLETLSLATQDAIKCAFGGMQTPGDDARAEQIAKATAFEVFSASSAENQSTLDVLQDVVRRTSSMPGSRSIVLLSSGFLALTPDTRQSLAELIDQALRADIVVNTLDIRGLHAAHLAPDSSHPSDPVARLRLDRDEALAQGEVIADLAYGTGGTFFHNSDDLDEGFRRTADSPEYFYVLGFSPQKLDGKFHRLKVRMKGAENLSVQARQGYYAFRPASP
jgi:VWFA-related protein